MGCKWKLCSGMTIKDSMKTKTSVLLSNHVRLKNVEKCGRVSALIFLMFYFFFKWYLLKTILNRTD